MWCTPLAKCCGCCAWLRNPTSAAACVVVHRRRECSMLFVRPSFSLIVRRLCPVAKPPFPPRPLHPTVPYFCAGIPACQRWGVSSPCCCVAQRFPWCCDHQQQRAAIHPSTCSPLLLLPEQRSLAFRSSQSYTYSPKKGTPPTFALLFYHFCFAVC